MIRRQLYTSSHVARVREDNLRKENQDKESMKVVNRDRLIAARMVSEERVENKRCGLNQN